jgi:hypothetical protein
MTGQHLPGHQYTPAEYALQQIVQSFSNLLIRLVEHHLNHTYRVVFRFSELENIDYLVQ